MTAIRRSGRFTSRAIELFLELERLPQHSSVFREKEGKSYELACLLGLENEWFFSCVHVHDRSRVPYWPEGKCAREDWFRVHAVRELLLEATGRSGDPLLSTQDTEG